MKQRAARNRRTHARPWSGAQVGDEVAAGDAVTDDASCTQRPNTFHQLSATFSASCSCDTASTLLICTTRCSLTQERLDDACYWIKQLVGLVCGICFGTMPVVGMHGLLTFGSLNVMLTYFMYTAVLRADLELLGPQGQWALIQEGFMPSVGVFMLTWILFYTLLHA